MIGVGVVITDVTERERALDAAEAAGERLSVLAEASQQLAGSLGTYRRARHILAFAAVPLALSLSVWPVRLAIYGTDVWRSLDPIPVEY